MARAAQVRALLDAAGGQEVRVLPCRGEALYGRLADALAAGEPDWAAPRPEGWPRGGEWGSKRVVLCSGMRRAPGGCGAARALARRAGVRCPARAGVAVAAVVHALGWQRQGRTPSVCDDLARFLGALGLPC